MGSEGQLSEFIDGLGPGQLVGRQVLASPALGEIQLSLCDRRGNLEVEVIRARGLQCKPGSKVLPGMEKYEVMRQPTQFLHIYSPVGEGVPRQWQEMPCQSQNSRCTTDSGSFIPATACLS